MLRTHLLLSLMMGVATWLSGQSIGRGFSPYDATQTHVVITLRGDRLVGHVERMTGPELLLRLESGQVVGLRFSELAFVGVEGAGDEPDEAAKLKPLAPSPRSISKRTVYTPRNMILGPTAFGTPDSRGEYRNTMLLLNAVEVDLSDLISVQLMALTAPFGGARIKARTSLGRFLHVGAGFGTYMDGLGLFDQPFTQQAYGIATVGTPAFFFNATVGRLFAFETELSQQRNFQIFGFGNQFGSRGQWHLYAELLLLAGRDGGPLRAIPAGMTSVALGRGRLELGLMVAVLVEDFLTPIPLAGYSISF